MPGPGDGTPGAPSEAADSGSRPFIVAIDGPAGAGKSTAARRLAARLGFALVDTGAIYRAVALAASRAGIAFDDDRRLAILLPGLRIRFEPPRLDQAAAGQKTILGEEDVSLEIRAPPMSLGASAVSARPVVRAALLDLQRRLASAPSHPGSVLEGRDIGTVVFPDADVKVFLTASPEVRARRRYDELLAKGQTVSVAQVLADQQKRDRDDSQRAVAPLRPAPDALLVDTSDLCADAVVDALAIAVEVRLEQRGRRPV
jgi:cytidylate kinase